MKTVVITGSTRGLGFGLAAAFLERGCRVVVSGRSDETVGRAMARLEEKERATGIVCDVRHQEQVQTLWDLSVEQFGPPDIWINNAGLANIMAKLWAVDPAELKAVVETNILGAAYGSRVAMQGMLAQGGGAIYNMEGMGADGRMHDGLLPYGMSKYALNYLTRGLVAETKGLPVLVGSIRPGMLVTDLLTDQYRDRPADWERAKRIFNIIADRVENVAPWIVERVLANQKHGVQFNYLNRPKLMGRFLLAPFRKRDLFS